MAHQDPSSASKAAAADTTWTRLLNFLARDASPLLGFLLGFLLVLLLLTCCTCCLYLAYLAWRRHLRRRTGRPKGAPSGSRRQLSASSSLAEDELEAAALARGQNLENWARQKRLEEEAARGGLGAKGQQPPVVSPAQKQRLQSILKKPGAPLARFEAIRPSEPPPPPLRRPSDHEQGPRTGGPTSGGEASPRRGALASSLRDSGRQPGPLADFRPTPARRLSRPVPPVPEAAAAGESDKPEPALGEASDDKLSFLSRTTTKTERMSSTSPSGQRLTVYEYSSDTARYSESYLSRRLIPAAPQRTSRVEQQQQPERRRTGGQRTPPAGGQTDEQLEPRQSSLI